MPEPTSDRDATATDVPTAAALQRKLLSLAGLLGLSDASLDVAVRAAEQGRRLDPREAAVMRAGLESRRAVLARELGE